MQFLKKATVVIVTLLAFVFIGSSVSAEGSLPREVTCENESAEASEISTILPAENYWTYSPRISDVYANELPSPVASAQFGEVVFLYSRAIGGSYSENFTGELGIWYMKAVVFASESYTALESEPISFSVLEESIVGVSILTPPEKTDYIAFDAFDSRGLSLLATYNSGRTETVESENISISYQRAAHILWPDTAVFASFMGCSVAVPISVERADYDISSIIFESCDVVYNGEYQTITPTGELPTGLDGIPLEYTVYSGKCDVGVYTVTMIFSTESEQYNTPEPISATLRILPLEVEIVWSDEPLVYDGTQKLPHAKAFDERGEALELTVLGGKIAAGEGYTATAILHSDNYAPKNPSYTYRILKADYDMSHVSWEYSDYTYDGKEKSVTLINLPEGVSVTAYINAFASDCGNYVAQARFSYDAVNYNEPSVSPCRWQILPAEYDISGIVFSDSEFVYDGKMHFPLLSGSFPVGADGSSPSYTLTKGATHVSDGCVRVVLTFASVSKNYIAPSPLCATVRITPRKITIDWSGTELVFSGEAQVPQAYSPYCGLTVSGEATDAGEYIAVAVADSTDFLIENGECAYRIKKAENALTSPLAVVDIYESGTPSPVANLLHGVALFRYFADEACTVELSLPLPAGEVFVKAYCDESENYLAFESAAVAFTVTPVLPVGIALENFRQSYLAYEVVSAGDVVVYLCYNDGGRAIIPHSDLTFSYERADSFRFGDASVTVGYSGFEASLPVNILRADYDLSGVVWSKNSFVYDGEEKRLTLTGLPEGVFVTYYENNGKRGAGEYEIIAHLSYDEDNYNPPTLPTCRLVIKKCGVAIPTIQNSEYSAAYQSAPIKDSPLYSVENISVKDAGVYTVSFTLADPQNYEWIDNEGAVCTARFEIVAREISLHIPPVTVYLFEGLPTDEVRYVESGIDGTLVEITLRTLEGGVVGISSDRNFCVRVIGGEVVRKASLSPTATKLVLLVLLLLLILALLIFVIKKYGRRVLLRIRRKRTAPVRLSVAADDAEDCDIPTPVSQKVPEEQSDMTEESRVENSIESSIEESILAMDESRADELISDALAKNLLRKDDTVIETYGKRKSIINVDTLSTSFSSGERVDVNLLKRKSLVPYDTGYIKVLARGVIDKPLRIYANDFSLSAVKMIALTGGEAVRCVTARRGEREKPQNS
ncbi:MAG: uL15 family ribosomal protein [Clostridia bacterium]|nr:uL15 family ribosomal protein [Clostridia bacterium]